MDATIKDNGDVWVDDHKIGHLEGLRFKIDESTSEIEAKALQAAAVKAVGPEVDRRLTSLCGGNHDIFTLSSKGEILWGGKAVGRIGKSGSVFTPDAELIGGEMGNENLRNLASDRMREFLRSEVAKKLEPLTKLKALSENETVPAPARGFAYVLYQENGSVPREAHFQTLKDLDQDSRRPLREIGVVFGQYNIFMKELMKPKPATLLGLLTAFGAGGHGKPFVPFAGVTSIPNTGEFESTQYTQEALSVAGYRACGPRIIRFDILDRLSKLVRDAQSQAPEHVQGRKFQVMQEMLAILGSTYEEARGVFEALGYKSETIAPVPKPDVSPASATEKTETAEGTKTPEADQDKAGLNASATPVTETVKTQIETDDTKPSVTDNVQASNPAQTPDQTPPQTQLNAQAQAPKSRSKKPAKSLNVFHRRIANEDGTNTTEENTEFWHMPFKKASGGRRNAQNNGNNKFSGKLAFKGKNAQKGGKGKSQRQDNRKSAEYKAREAKRIEDSPFAALAALKKPK